MPRETAVMFVGVSAGYGNSEAEVLSPEAAHNKVRDAISKIRAFNKNDKNTYHVYSGLAVYRKENGCPDGGEPVAAVITAGDVGAAINLAEALRVALNQSTVTVASYNNGHGKKTIGFYARVNGDLRAVAHLWQDAADTFFNDTGIELTCGLYLNGTQLVMQGELNPDHGDNPDDWKTHINAVIEKLGKKLSKDITVQFRNAGFTYLTKA